MMNKCIFMGTIFTTMNNDPITVKTYSGKDGQPFNTCTFKLNMYEKTGTDAQGKAEYKHVYIPMKAIGKKADTIIKYFTPGKAAIVECEYETYSTPVMNNGQPVYENGKQKMNYGHIFNVVQIHFVQQDKSEVSQNYNNLINNQQINNQFNNAGQYSGAATFNTPNANTGFGGQPVNNASFGQPANNTNLGPTTFGAPSSTPAPSFTPGQPSVYGIDNNNKAF